MYNPSVDHGPYGRAQMSLPNRIDGATARPGNENRESHNGMPQQPESVSWQPSHQKKQNKTPLLMKKVKDNDCIPCNV